jgi:hypothetical protein
MTSYRRMVIILLCMVATAVMLQGMFEASDHAKSERIVQNYRGAGGPSLAERLAQVAPGGVWSSEITHGCRGFVRVSYTTPNVEYVFDYDVPQHLIHPANPAAAQLLSQVPAAPPPKE